MGENHPPPIRKYVNTRASDEQRAAACDNFETQAHHAESASSIDLRSRRTTSAATFQERNVMDEQRAPQQAAGQGQVQIKADEKELLGQYSNLVMIHHNLEEFTLNFIYIFPNGAQGKLMSSTIVSPGHAKRIWRALGENLARYEAQFGAIKEAPEGGPTPNVGFVQ
jgi:uncharacterized protein DUF3467